MTWKNVQTRWYNPRVSREAEAKSLYNIPPILDVRRSSIGLLDKSHSGREFNVGRICCLIRVREGVEGDLVNYPKPDDVFRLSDYKYNFNRFSSSIENLG